MFEEPKVMPQGPLFGLQDIHAPSTTLKGAQLLGLLFC